MRQDGEVAARLGCDDLAAPTCRTRFSSSRPFDQATAEQLLGFASGLFGDLHCVGLQLRFRLATTDHAAICRLVSSASRRWSSAVRILPVTVVVVCTTSRPTSRLSSASMRSWSGGGGFARLGDDLFGGGDGFLGFLLLHAGGGGAGLLDELVGLGVGLAQHLLAGRFGPGQFGFDLLGVGEAFGDALAALFQHVENGLVGEALEQDARR